MNDILAEIIAHKKMEIEQQKQAVSLEQLQNQAVALIQENSEPRRSMKKALAASASGIISEFKRRSPSKGWINETAGAELIPASYETAGAAALSILTDEKFFGGSLRDLRTARSLVNIPILRKDFIIDEYQLYQARIVGADAVLLIAACLTPEQCSTLTAQAHALGLEVLLEIHSSDELTYVSREVDMVGVNNRNLGSFATDIENSFRIAKQLQETVETAMLHPANSKAAEAHLMNNEAGAAHTKENETDTAYPASNQAVEAHLTNSEAETIHSKSNEVDTVHLTSNKVTVHTHPAKNEDHSNQPLLISESGISSPETICKLRQSGFRGFLIGETFMKTVSPGETLSKFISQIEAQQADVAS